MTDVLAALAVTVMFAVVLGGLVWAAARVRRRGGGASLMGPFEEIYHPGALRANIEVQVQDERQAPNPSTPDKLLPER